MIWILLLLLLFAVWLGVGFHFVIKNVGAIMFGTPRTEWYHIVLMAPVLVLIFVGQKIHNAAKKVCK